MNDEQLKREIEEALATEPSPQFIARVRRQIANEPLRARRLPWMMLSSGLVAVALLTGAALFLSGPSPSVTPPKVVETPPSLEVQPAPPSAVPKAVSRPKPVPPRQRQLEVLIDPREAAALKKFIDDVQEQKIDPSRLEELFAGAQMSEADAIEPVPIAGLDSIVIEPLKSAASERGGDL